MRHTIVGFMTARDPDPEKKPAKAETETEQEPVEAETDDEAAGTKKDRYPGTRWRAEKLRADMEAAGVRPQMLADALGVSSQVVSNWRRDGAIAAKHLPALAEMLGRPVEEYLAAPEAPPVPGIVREAGRTRTYYVRVPVELNDPRRVRLAGRRFVQIRPFMHAATPGGAAARAALEGARTMLVSVRTDLSGKAFAVEIPEGMVGPTGAATGGCVVVDPEIPARHGDVLLTFSERSGPRLRKLFEAGEMRFTAPIGPALSDSGVSTQRTEPGEFTHLGVCCEWHPTPVVLSASRPETSPED